MSYKQKLKKRGPKKNWAKNQPRAGFYNPNSITNNGIVVKYEFSNDFKVKLRNEASHTEFNQ